MTLKDILKHAKSDYSLDVFGEPNLRTRLPPAPAHDPAHRMIKRQRYQKEVLPGVSPIPHATAAAPAASQCPDRRVCPPPADSHAPCPLHAVVC